MHHESMVDCDWLNWVGSSSQQQLVITNNHQPKVTLKSVYKPSLAQPVISILIQQARIGALVHPQLPLWGRTPHPNSYPARLPSPWRDAWSKRPCRTGTCQALMSAATGCQVCLPSLMAVQMATATPETMGYDTNIYI